MSSYGYPLFVGAGVYTVFLCLFTVPTTVYAAFAVGLCMHFLQISVSLVVTLLY